MFEDLKMIADNTREHQYKGQRLEEPQYILGVEGKTKEPLSDVVGVALLVCFTAIIITAMILVWG